MRATVLAATNSGICRNRSASPAGAPGWQLYGSSTAAVHSA